MSIKYRYIKAENRPNVHKIYQHLPLLENPNLDFWFENVPSGNPGGVLNSVFESRVTR
jgi:hypothetical protein